MAKPKRYDQVMAHLFENLFSAYGSSGEIPFSMEDVKQTAQELGIKIGNAPDIKYSYTGRAKLPDSIAKHGEWVIMPVSKGQYKFFRLKRPALVDIPSDLEITLIPDATPDVVLKHQANDEQALLARIRYNRLMDIFTGLVCYPLQSHFRTTVAGSQCEIDDLYIGINSDGTSFIIPVEAKTASTTDRLGVIQIYTLIQFARQHYMDLTPRPVGIKQVPDGSLVFLEFKVTEDLNAISTKTLKRYKLYREEGLAP